MHFICIVCILLSAANGVINDDNKARQCDVLVTSCRTSNVTLSRASISSLPYDN